MKKICLSLAIVYIAGTAGYAQSAEPAVLRTAHYEITAEGNARSAADVLGRELELRFDTFNRLFRFDPAQLAAPLKVRVFIDRGLYDGYVSARLGQTRAGAVYFHYNQAERRELVVLRGSPEEASMLPHQAFVQFLRGFISNPPAWMREGFAIYFSGLKFDPAAAALSYEENLSWLETVKALGKTAPPVKTILEADASVSSLPQNFQICSWALSSFFLNSGKGDYFRTLTDSFMVLSDGAAAVVNSDAVLRRMSRWTDFDVLERDYKSYLDSRKTFAELMDDGRGAYAARNPVTAEICFLSALEQRPRHYAPYYYLGLIYYEEKSYDMAEEYYRSSLEYGADEALVSYALGLNAASAGRNADAVSWLRKAAAADPARYQTRAEELIGRLSR
jgi:tetratricopeptide (TPR) repeat protein